MEHDTTANESAPLPRKGKVWLKRSIHALVILITVGFIARQLQQASGELYARDFRVHWGWLAVACCAYAGGLTFLSTVWWAALADVQAPVTAGGAIRAYLISHVGKYVPGKAMVIVIRCGLLRGSGVSVGTITLMSFYETFATMASGSITTALCVALLDAPNSYARAVATRPWILWSTIAVLVVFFGAAITPAGFQFITRAATLPFKSARKLADRRISIRVGLAAVVLGMISWMTIGCSFLATVNAVSAETTEWRHLPTATASVALSIVVGFLSMLPGQALVREAILIKTFEPVIGKAGAIVAALMFRLVTLATEGALGVILYFGGRR